MTAPRDLVVWGAKGHAKVLREFMLGQGYRIVALVDNDPDVVSPFEGVRVLRGEAGLADFMADRREATFGITAIGGFRGRDRMAILDRFARLGIAVVSAVHPTAFVAADARIGPGAHVLAQAAVGADASIGEATIINTRASVDHECIIGPGVHIAPGATLAGCVTIGAGAFVGPGAVVTSGIRIGEDTIVGAGAVVVRDLPAGVTAFGVPARIVRSSAGR